MRQRKIVVIDDEPIWHRLIKRLFVEYDVQSAVNCSDGVSMVEKLQPDCILLDFHLNDGDAVSVCSALRKTGRKLNIPVVVVSSDPDAEITARTAGRLISCLKGPIPWQSLKASLIRFSPARMALLDRRNPPGTILLTDKR